MERDDLIQFLDSFSEAFKGDDLHVLSTTQLHSTFVKVKATQIKRRNDRLRFPNKETVLT